MLHRITSQYARLSAPQISTNTLLEITKSWTQTYLSFLIILVFPTLGALHFVLQPKNVGVKIDNSSIERVEGFTYLGTTLTDQNSIQEEIKSRLKLGNA